MVYGDEGFEREMTAAKALSQDSLMRSDQGNLSFLLHCKQVILKDLFFKFRRHV